MLKKGPLEKNEQEYIIAHSRDKSVVEISKDLSRQTSTIRRYIKLNSLPTTIEDRQSDTLTRGDIKDILRQKSFYTQIKKQLSHDELNYFEEIWVDALQQFEMDIKPTEELQLKRLLLLDIQADRINILKKQHSEDLIKKQMLLNVELEKTTQDRDREAISVLQAEIAAIRSSIQSFGREVTGIISETKHIQKDLKATRDQRSDTINDSKQNFVSWLKIIQDTKYRRVVNKEMNILKLATEKASDKLGEYIEYADGQVERQLLNEDTVYRDEDINNNEE